jgi:Flp pilus assembly protein protease CpaA
VIVTATSPPRWRPGDRWVYEFIAGSQTATKTIEVARTEAVAGVTYYVANLGEIQEYFTRDIHWAASVRNSKVEARMVPPQPWYVWPLESGRRWTHRAVFEGPQGQREQVHRFSVIGSEVVEVPAGQFPGSRRGSVGSVLVLAAGRLPRALGGSARTAPVRGASEGVRLRRTTGQHGAAHGAGISALISRRRSTAVAILALAACFIGLQLRRRGVSLPSLAVTPLLAALAAATVLDLTSRLVPDRLTLPSLAYALALGAILPMPGPIGAVLGAAVAGGLALLVAMLSRGGVGGGDVKLAAVVGASLGWGSALAVLALSQVLGLTIVLLVSLLRWRLARAPLPVGSIIATLGALVLIGRPA